MACPIVPASDIDPEMNPYDIKSHQRQQRLIQAEELAKRHSVDVLATNNKPGKEWISFQGEGDKLLVLKADLEKLGWHQQPLDPEEENVFMDFALQPPTPEAVKAYEGKKRSQRKTAVIPPREGQIYQYRGTPFFWARWFFILFLVFLVLAVNAKLKDLEFATKVQIFGAVGGVLGATIFFFSWTEVLVDSQKLLVRNLWRKPREYAIAELKSVEIYVDKDRRGKKTSSKSIHATLRSGAGFNLTLPHRQVEEFYRFFRPEPSS